MVQESHSVTDLRSALRLLAASGDAPLTIREPVSPQFELAAAYAWFGGGTPVAGRPRGERALLFEQGGPLAASVLVGLFASRRRCAALLGCEELDIGERLVEAVRQPLEPVLVEGAPCQEVVHERVDLARLPIPTISPGDAGPYITMGVVFGSDPDGSLGNISIHRLCVQSADRLTIWMVPGRDLEQLYLAAKAQGRRLPISINIGLDPAVYVAAACTGPLAPPGSNELGIAGAIRGRAIGIAPCRSVPAHCIAHAEYVLEGEITHETIPESRPSSKSMPEFLGYDGAPHPALPVVHVTAITHRRDPVFQTVIGPGCEQSNLLAFGMEAGILDFLGRYVTKRVCNVRAHPGGGGQLLVFIQVSKTADQDDGMIRRAGTAVLGAFRMVKQVVLVDDDVDLFNDSDLWWAMATRFQVGRDAIVIGNIQGFPLDPSQSADFHSGLSAAGNTDKVVLDCTVPFRLRRRFQRSRFGAIPEGVLKEILEKTTRCE